MRVGTVDSPVIRLTNYHPNSLVPGHMGRLNRGHYSTAIVALISIELILVTPVLAFRRIAPLLMRDLR